MISFKNKNIKLILAKLGFCILFMVCAMATLMIGDSPWNSVWTHAIERINGTSSQWNPLLDERIPRLIVILCTGASLAVAGAVMQSIFNNPLASPNILGISCGGGLVVVFIFVMEWHLNYPFIIPIGAFLGSLLTLITVYMLSRSREAINLNTLILTGIAVSSLLLAIQAGIMYALRDKWMLIQTLTEWEAGSTIDRNWKHVHMQLPLTIIGTLGCWHYRSEIDILSLGEEEAQNLGVEVKIVRWRLFLCVALLTGGALASVGSIAFFGLVLPLLVRYIQGPSNYQLIPLCLLIGSASFAAIDLLLRIFEVHSLSIGNVAAILGGLTFLFLITNSHYLRAQRD